MKSRPRNGCIMLDQLRNTGQYLIGFNPSAHEAFKTAQQAFRANRTAPAFFDTVERAKDGEPPRDSFNDAVSPTNRDVPPISVAFQPQRQEQQ